MDTIPTSATISPFSKTPSGLSWITPIRSRCLSFTVLLGMAGLTIDVARAYDLYARMQRAAEAGALAGVLYMPLNYTTNYKDGNNAIKRALQETVKNGFGLPVLQNLPGTIPST